MLIELHLLTSHAPSNLNRDDFGRPKTAYFGGTERGRISSQSQKRALRRSDYLKGTLAEKLSTRSRAIPRHLFDTLAPRFEGQADRLERLRLVCEAVTFALGKPDKDDVLATSQIVFLTQDEIARLLAFVEEKTEDDGKLSKKELAEFGKTIARATGLDVRPTDGVDMAMFGRMTTDDAGSFAAVDAAMQVAHPIATHTTLTETDYFTAVDDIGNANAGGRGSAHIGESDFNSAVYYKYFSCNLDALALNLGDDRAAALTALEAVLDAACRVTPTGKQNSFASHSQADAALLVVRESNVPCSLANAFERPVPASEDGYLAGSLRALAGRYARLVRGYELEDEAALFTLQDDVPDGPFERAERLADLWAFLRRHAGAAAPAEG